MTDVCKSTLDFSMTVTRIHEDPRVTRPFSEAQWSAIDTLGHAGRPRARRGDVRLTVGGEPTFVSIDDMEGAEWNFTGDVGAQARARDRPPLPPARALRPRRACCTSARASGIPASRCRAGRSRASGARTAALWETRRHGRANATQSRGEAARFATELAQQLGLSPDYVMPAYEDPWRILRDESNLPLNVDPLAEDTQTEPARRRLADASRAGLGKPVGYVLPLKALARGKPANRRKWASSPWPLRREKSSCSRATRPRLPPAAGSLPELLPEDDEPTSRRSVRPAAMRVGSGRPSKAAGPPRSIGSRCRIATGAPREGGARPRSPVEARKGHLYVFQPPTNLPRGLHLARGAVETAAAVARMGRAPRGLSARRTTRASALRGHARSRRDRGEHPSPPPTGED
jgi:uncharacterized protein (DUF2126 family)